ncbi:hypothetical protein [Ketobacter sp.]|nr:MAG: hypothetical protein D6160_09040 [Ketobacter sp.]
MSNQKIKPNWNGLLSTSFVLLIILAGFMGYQIARMGGAAGEPWGSTHNLSFIALFVGVLVALAGLKWNPKYFSLLGVLMCLVLIAQILAFTGLFTLESLFASVAILFLVLGNLKLRKK